MTEYDCWICERHPSLCPYDCREQIEKAEAMRRPEQGDLIKTDEIAKG